MLFGASFLSVQKATLGSGSPIGLSAPCPSGARGFGVSKLAFFFTFRIGTLGSGSPLFLDVGDAFWS